METKLQERITALSANRKRLLTERLRALDSDKRRPGDRLVAAVTGHGIDTGELRRICENELPSYMVPQLIVELDELPRTSAGKIDRKGIQQLTWSESNENETSTGIVRPSSDNEKILADIWCDVLGFDEISIHDNFFEVGGDSLLTIRILSRAAKSGLRIAPDAFFQNPTIAGQAALVTSAFDSPGQQGPVSGAVPLLPIQHWYFENIRSDVHHWNQSFLFELAATTSTERIETALQTVVDCHDALRTRFQKQGDQWTAEILAKTSGNIVRRVDLTDLSENDASNEITTISNTLNTGFDLTVAPLLAAAHFVHAKDRKEKLLIVAHHLIIDMESWRVVIDDLATLLESGADAVASSPATGATTYQAWSQKLSTLAENPEVEKDRRYWEHRLQNLSTELPLDFQSSSKQNKESNTATVSACLNSEETTSLVVEASNSLRASPYVILVTAMARSIAKWTNEVSILMETEGHGREFSLVGLDASRTVGWLTTVYPLVLTASSAEVWRNPESALRTVKEAVSDVPNNGITYGLLRDLSTDLDRGSAIKTYGGAQLLFNFLGHTDSDQVEESTLKLIDSTCGKSRSKSCERAFLVEVNARIEERKLIVDFAYNDTIHKAETIDRLAQTFITAVCECIDLATDSDARVATSSDFPLANLSTEEIDRISSQLESLDE